MFASVKRGGLVIAGIIMFAAAVFGQNGNSISGSVTDSTGAVVNGAEVKAIKIGSTQEITTVSDTEGKYVFSGLAAGSYRVSATADGFATSAENVLLSGGDSKTLDFSLSPGAITDTVTVTAGKGTGRIATEVPQPITVTTSDQIEKRAPASTFEAMERAPNLGVIETNPARQRPRLRGLSSNRVLIVVDGEKLNNARSDPTASGAPIAIIDPAELEAVEVVAGSGSSLYGSDAMGGTINLITKSPKRPDEGILVGIRLGGNYFSNGKIRRGNATLNASNQTFAFRASGSLYKNENYNMGGEAVSLQQVLDIGNFYLTLPGNNATGYPVFDLPAGSEILNGEGSGGGMQFDMWFFPSENHIFRGRYLGRDEGFNGNAFSGPPYEAQERYADFRDFRKFGLRYEGLDFSSFLPRVAVNYYRQKNSRPQNQFTWTNEAAGGSYINNTTFSGLRSIFTPRSFVHNQNTITSYGIDLQATLMPFTGMLVTVGGGKTNDFSSDLFISSAAGLVNGVRSQVGSETVGASSPDSTYTDNNFYVQAEFDRVRWVRVTGGLRYDNWVTEALPTTGFPLSTESTVLNAVEPLFLADPRGLAEVASAYPRLRDLAAGNGSAGSDSTSWAGNFGIVGRLPGGINPYFRVANSYREPGITERYLIRNFAPFSFFAPLVIGNPNLQPEKGLNYDVGVKVQRSIFNFSLGYFHNKIENLTVFAPGQSYCTPPAPPFLPGGFASLFIVPGCPPFQAIVNVNARINQSEATIKGWESTAEASISLGDMGSLNPFYSLGLLHGTNETPTQSQLDVLNQIQSAASPIELSGSASDFPLRNITPFRLLGGAQYLDAKGRFFAEYNFRHQAQVKRADPNLFLGTTLINYGTFKALDSFTKHSIKGGYTWTNESYKIGLTAGVDNFLDTLFWEHFQTAPAPGRSFIFGATFEVFNFFKK